MTIISLKEARERQTKLKSELRRRAEDILNPPTVTPDRFRTTWFADIADDHRKDWIVKDVLGKGEFSVVSGKPGSGKSVILGDLACHIASGMEWHGRRVEQGLVIYIAAERKDLTERRFLAFRKKHDVRDIPLLVLGGSLDFTRDTADAVAIVQAVKQAEQHCGMPCRWVVIDTLTRVFGGGDQNTSKDMTRLIRSIDVLMHGTGAHITIVHHTGWETDRAKGAIDLDGAVDASFIVANTGGAYNLRCDGANDGPEGSITNFGLELVQIGTNDDGEPTTAPIVVPRESKAKLLQSGGPKGIAATVLTALRDAISDVGIKPEGDHFPGDILAVTEDQWREQFYATNTTLPQETVRKQFQRGVKALRDADTIAQIEQWCWPN